MKRVRLNDDTDAPIRASAVTNLPTGAAMNEADRPAEVYGRLLEGAHVAGYTFERACTHLEWLLTDDRWREVRGGFTDVNAFLASVRFDDFRVLAEQRKRLVSRIKALQPDAQNTKIAKALGVSEITVRRDASTNVEAGQEKTNGTSRPNVGSSTNVELSGAQAAKLAARHETTARTRQARDDGRRRTLYSAGEIAAGIDLHVGDFRELSPNVIPDESVQLVFTDPPWDESAIPLYEAAAKEAARILKPGGSLIIYSGQAHLIDAGILLRQHLKQCWVISANNDNEDQPAQMFHLGIKVLWKPLLWAVKDYRGDAQNFVRDVVIGSRQKDWHPWQQPIDHAEYYIEQLTSEGGAVVDFMAGSGTTLVAAKRLNRPAIGFEIDPAAAAKIKARLKADFSKLT
jgi:16S rRNA G966 N2-methylase RsmD